jgi:sporulation protein YqfC
MSKQRKNIETIIESLELPQDLFEGMPNIFLTGNRKLYISNHRGILTYDSDEIIILTKTVQVKVQGEELIIESYSKDELVIRGYISFVGME